jgi:hypothetical protein
MVFKHEGNALHSSSFIWIFFLSLFLFMAGTEGLLNDREAYAGNARGRLLYITVHSVVAKIIWPDQLYEIFLHTKISTHPNVVVLHH